MTPISLNRFTKSVRHAMHGLAHAFMAENNFRIHTIFGLVVVMMLVILKVPRRESALIVLVVASVLILELVNTIVERFADMLEPRVHPYVHVIKDLMAAVVVIAAIAAIIVGILIFWPYVSSAAMES
jgi:diacylglycerol kinase